MTKIDYYSPEANRRFCSNSQLKSFLSCEARAVAEMNGEWQMERTKALDMGSFFDALLVNNHEDENWIEEHKDIVYMKNGKMYSDFIKVGEIACKVKQQPLMMKYLDGEHQRMMIGEIDGLPFKIRMDTYKEGEFISDLKLMASCKSPNLYTPMLEYWGYTHQAAIYVEIVRQNTGKTLPFYFVIATKENPTHLEVAHISEYDVNKALEEIRPFLPRIKAIKEGLIQPERCEKYDCPYCTETRILDEPIDASMLGMTRKNMEE